MREKSHQHPCQLWVLRAMVMTDLTRYDCCWNSGMDVMGATDLSDWTQGPLHRMEHTYDIVNLAKNWWLKRHSCSRGTYYYYSVKERLQSACLLNTCLYFSINAALNLHQRSFLLHWRAVNMRTRKWSKHRKYVTVECSAANVTSVLDLFTPRLREHHTGGAKKIVRDRDRGRRLWNSFFWAWKVLTLRSSLKLWLPAWTCTIHQILSDTMDPGGTPELPPLLGTIGHSRVLGVLDSFLFGSMAAEGFPDSGELLCIYMQESIFIFLC